MTINTRAIILAAGRGSRMKHLTDLDPKCKTVLHGKALIEWQFQSLQRAGITDIAVVTGYQKDRIDVGGERFENPRWHESNMVRSLLAAKTWLRRFPCIVSYSDIVYSSQIAKDLVADANDELTLAYDPNWYQLWRKRFEDPTDDGETFKLQQQRIVEIGGKIRSLNDVQGQYMGLLKFTPQSWSTVEDYLGNLASQSVDKLDMTSLLSQLISENVTIMGVPNHFPWYEVDSESDLDIYQSMPPVEQD